MYVSHLRDLFHQPSEQDYNDHYEKLRNDWSKAFCDYFDQNIYTKVCTALGQWILEQYGLYNSVSGITTKQSEGFNAVLKRIQQWREIPVDSIVLSLYYLQAFYWNEWQRGLASLGERLNPLIFAQYRHPLTLEEHTARMTRQHVWGTQTDIMAGAAYFRVPVYVALSTV